MDVSSQLKQTPLNALHRELGARLVPFAGYEMRSEEHTLNSSH